MRALILAAALLAASPAHADYRTVKTDKGQVSGRAENGVLAFKGVPFAAPPVGKLRWRAPQPAAKWSGIRAATAFGDSCISTDANPRPGAPKESEDCLTLNLWRPATPAKKLPVMVWIYGGGLTAGTSALPEYDGAAFARQDVILVSINYRLGMLGFFSHPALTKANADGGRLHNYGLMDQIAALAWVQRNIAAFGGDPSRVTIFGESAGAASVYALMTSPPARGLFSGAIVQSGYGRRPLKHISDLAPGAATSAEQDGVAQTTYLGIETNDLAALRAVPAEVFKKRRGPVIGHLFAQDGHILTDDLWSVFRQGKEAPVPLIVGANSHESIKPADPATNAFYQAGLLYAPESEHAPLEAVYGGRDAFLERFSSDMTYVGTARSLAALHIKNGHKAWRYRFSVLPDVLKPTQDGVRHAGEIPYVFDTLPVWRTRTGPKDAAAAKQVNAYWAAFARDGKPAAANLPAWPQASGEMIMEFTEDGPVPKADPRAHILETLSKIADPRS